MKFSLHRNNQCRTDVLGIYQELSKKIWIKHGKALIDGSQQQG
jgi:hypothetical protein